ncbi:protein of unassigned function [Methylobacterium oryzae CBMB20]|uniref:Protein of unassigned function n=1 Tax=Methylobacterium oryzae CBMB20 TaxID=693986 RepID=A0A089P1K0_9HYPH|nr:protein of unassigned function [Methylobacterium oryzae CBMB20]
MDRKVRWSTSSRRRDRRIGNYFVTSAASPRRDDQYVGRRPLISPRLATRGRSDHAEPLRRNA